MPSVQAMHVLVSTCMCTMHHTLCITCYQPILLASILFLKFKQHRYSNIRNNCRLDKPLSCKDCSAVKARPSPHTIPSLASSHPTILQQQTEQLPRRKYSTKAIGKHSRAYMAERQSSNKPQLDMCCHCSCAGIVASCHATQIAADCASDLADTHASL